jgi:hypothetical protein
VLEQGNEMLTVDSYSTYDETIVQLNENDVIFILKIND